MGKNENPSYLTPYPKINFISTNSTRIEVGKQEWRINCDWQLRNVFSGEMTFDLLLREWKGRAMWKMDFQAEGAARSKSEKLSGNRQTTSPAEQERQRKMMMADWCVMTFLHLYSTRPSSRPESVMFTEGKYYNYSTSILILIKKTLINCSSDMQKETRNIF